MIDIGKLDRPITIETPILATDSYGQKIKTFALFATTRANVKLGSEKEDFNSEQFTSVNETIFKIRYRPGVNTSMRIVYNGNNYDILGIKELGRLDALEIRTDVEKIVDTIVRNG